MTLTHGRVTSLDTLRGLAVAAMILVNNPGNWNAVYPALTHSAWNGCTFADLIFPFFIFIMGVAMPLALARRQRTPGQAAHLRRRVWARAAVLVAVGLVLNAVGAWPHLATIRIPGVLQRIGLTYLAAALIVLRFRVRDQAAAAGGLLIAHWSLLLFLPRILSIDLVQTPAHNLAASLDRAVFGAHMLMPTGDPEGLLGLVPSVATALLGVLAGWWMLTAADARSRIVGLFAGGVLGAGAGLLWSLFLPLNKFLWTGSFALFACGIAAVAFAGCYLVIDLLHVTVWSRPFVWLGFNPLLVYALSELIARILDMPLLSRAGRLHAMKDVVFWQWLAPRIGDSGGVRSSLVFATCYAAIWILVAGLLHRRGIALRA